MTAIRVADDRRANSVPIWRSSGTALAGSNVTTPAHVANRQLTSEGL